MHTDEKVDAFVSQNWIIENDQDKSKSLGFDLPEGTWFGAVKVKDSEFWMSKVKSDEVKGFSVEILADLQLALKNKKQKMKKMKFKKKFIGTQKFDEAVETEAGELIVVAEEIAVGEDVVVVMDDLSVVETFDGEIMVDGDTVVIEGGQITEVIEGGEVIEEVPIEEELAEEGEPTGAVTADDVSMMIDSRFAELMEEISRLKGIVEGQGEEFKKTITKSIKDAFSVTPAQPSIRKGGNVDEKFKSIEDRVRSFAKNK
jgi:signal peptidase I